MTTSDQRPLSVLSVLAVLSLAGYGLWLAVSALPPLFDIFYREEAHDWYGPGVANGLLYLAAAVLIGAYRSRLGIALGLILGLAGFTLMFGVMVTRLSTGFAYGEFPRRELLFFGGVAAVHAVVIVGALAGGRRSGFVAEPRRSTILAAAILAGVGISLGFGAGGGAFAILLSPTGSLDWLQAIEGWLPLPHFVAAVALTLDARFARVIGLVASVGGVLLSLAVIVSMEESRFGEMLNQLDSVALWTLFLLAYGLAAAVLARGWRSERRKFGRGEVYIREAAPGSAPPA